uniref:Uncharacterized protein n=1 Tax=Gossypium raimondii TaxID=29730 RepID=A0A0D2PD39_GOSRA|nr:hypothetical protein B456_007G227900 [Gossypium raimondii]
MELEAKFIKVTVMHQPGIEPGSVPWQGTILPLDHWCFVARGCKILLIYKTKYLTFIKVNKIHSLGKFITKT